MFILFINMELDKMTKQLELLNNQKQTTIDSIDRDIIDEEIIRIEKEIELAKQVQDLQSSCSHTFVEDLIDVNPEKSMTIQYCIHCFFTAKNCNEPR